MPGDYDFLLGGAQGIRLPDPMAQAQNAMSLAQLAGQHQLQQYALAKTKREDEATNALNAALPALIQSGYSPQAIQQAMQQNPNAASAILGQVQKQQQADAETAYKRAQTTKDTAAAGKDDWQVREGKIKLVAGDAYQRLANNPNPSPDDVHAVLNTAKTAGLDIQALNLPTEATPQAWQQWGRSFANMSVSAPDQIKFAGEAATRAETNRSHIANETLTGSRDANTANYQRAEIGVKQGELANSNMRARAAMVTADPFGLSGLNTGAAGGASGMGAPSGGQPATDAQMNMQVAPLTAQQTAMQSAANTGGQGGVGGAMRAGLTGDQFLQSLPPAIAAQVKAMAEGKAGAPPSGAALRSPQVMQLMELTRQYDPTFDATTWGARSSMAKDWGDQGAIGKSNLAINTVIGHLGDLQKSAASLNNTSFTPVNAVVNGVQNLMGDPRYKEFEANAGAVAKELERAYRGTGGSQSDIDAMKGELNSSNSPQQLTGVIKKYVDLLQSKIEANADAYTKTMGREPPALLSNKAQSTRDALSGGDAAPSGGSAVKIKGDDGYNALPSGSLFVGPDGVTRRKP